MAQKDKNSSKSNTIKYSVIAVVVIVLLAGLDFVSNKNTEKSKTENTKNVTLSESGDLIIPIQEVSEKASFYPVEIDGTALEVLAVKAPDGTVRTAFNTCQICYSSGRGYYVQDGDVLVCQNCRNEFKTSEVEIVKGGCNPVPILEEDKVVDANNITISNAFLTEAKGIFENWKSEY